MYLKIKELPKKEKAKAIKRMFQQRGVKDDNYPLCMAFNWGDTKEGFYYWEGIDKGNEFEEGKMTVEEFLGIDPRLISVKDPEIVKPDSIVESVISKFRDRSNVGIEKYGTTLDRKDINFDGWAEHLQQELMDGILYLERLRKDFNA